MQGQNEVCHPLSAQLHGDACHRACAGSCLLAPHWFENLEAAHQGLINGHHCPSIVKLATVVWCTEQSDQLPLREKLAATFRTW